MNSYAYRAVHTSGQLHKGTLKAENENELISVLSRKNLELIEAHTIQEDTRTISQKKDKNETSKLIFARQIQDLLKAGLPFSEALALILDTTEEGFTKNNLTSVETSVRSGNSISHAIAQQKNWFDPISLAIIEAGEKSGKLTEAFNRLEKHLIKQKDFRRTLLRAIRYPLFLLCVAFSTTIFMMLWVVPQIVSFLISNGNELPLATRVLIISAEIFEMLWWLIPVLVSITIGTIFFMRRFSTQGLCYTDKWLLKIPFLGPIWHKLAIARFMNSLTLLLKSGLSLPMGLLMAAQSLNNHYLVALSQDAHHELLNGQSFSESMRNLFSPYFLQLIKIGEKSGHLPKVLDDIATTTENEAHNSLSSFLAALEPALTLFVGALLVWVVLAVLGPLYSSLGSLSGSM